MMLQNFIYKVIGFTLIVLASGCGGGSGGAGHPQQTKDIFKEMSLADVIQIESYNDSSGTTFFLTSNGQVYSLDASNFNYDSSSAKTEQISGLSNIVKISAGTSHLLALDKQGNVFGYGDNSDGELGMDRDSYPFLSTPEQITQLQDVVDISAGSEFSIVVDKNGSVYSFGGSGCNTSLYTCDDNETQLGFYDTNNTQFFDNPIKINSLHDIISADSGEGFTVVVDKNGDVYSFGFGANGRLGQGGSSNSVIPKKIASLSDIKQISVGSAHTLVLDTNNKVYGFGNSLKGELSLGNYATDEQSDPIEITTVSDVKSVAAGNGYSLFLTNNGDLYSSGSNTLSNRLGLQNTPENSEIFNATKIPNLANIAYFGTGMENSFFVNQDKKLKVTYDPPVEINSGNSSCGDSKLIGRWVRSSDNNVKVTFNSNCTALIIQDSNNGYSATLKTYLSNVHANGKTMNYTLSKMVYIDSSGTTTQQSGKSYTNIDYSVDGETLSWGGYSYNKY